MLGTYAANGERRRAQQPQPSATPAPTTSPQPSQTRPDGERGPSGRRGDRMAALLQGITLTADQQAVFDKNLEEMRSRGPRRGDRPNG